MPALVSDIHEISVLVGLVGEVTKDSSIDEKYDEFKKFSDKFSKGSISISITEFKSKEALFDRAIDLAKELVSKYGIEGNNIRWAGLEDHTEDSSDIYSDGVGISLKDSSKIVRNNGFEQLLKTFNKKPIKEFKDPFWEFAPGISREFIISVIEHAFEKKYLKIEGKELFLDGKKRVSYNGTQKSLLALNLIEITKIVKKADLKKLVKFFSTTGDLKKLYVIRCRLVDDVSKKVVAVLKEGMLSNPSHVNNSLKYLLQYRETKKLFGFSSSNMLYAGSIPKDSTIELTVKKIFTEESKLTENKTGLQINLYTDLELKFDGKKNELRLQNQLRYKHRTFSCAPEANLHILNYQDWKLIYPTK